MLTVDLSRLNLPPNTVILDLGCGEGRHSISLAAEYTHLQVVGIDINREDINTANARKSQFELQSPCYFIQSDGKKLPFNEDSFDLVICSEVLEHIHNYQSFIAEIRRILKPNGQLAVSVPRYWPEKICWMLEKRYYMVEGGHVRIFHYKEIKNSICNAGFYFESRHWAHGLHTPYWWLRCLFWNQGDKHPVVRTYHKMLLWDLFKKPWITQNLDKLLNPLMGKSVVLYFKKQP